jgi:hypothetical protein
MKNVIRLLAVAALATTFALPAFAQTATPAQTPAPAATPAAGPCTTEVEAKAALYKKFLDNYKGTPEQQKLASQTGNEYLTKYGNCTDDSDKQITAFVQKWVGKYEAASADFNCTKAVNENPAQAFTVCAPLRDKDPQNLKYHLMLVAAGIKAYTNKDNSLNARAAAEARTALQLIESGKTTDQWAPFTSQQDAPAGLRYYIAAWTFEANPDEAANQLRTIAQSNSSVAKEPATYQLLGASYYNGEYKKLATEYKERCEGKDASPECDALLNKVNAVTDRIIDAYARAVALSKGKPQEASLRNTLTTFYKQRHDNSEAGLNELLSNVLSKPVMLPGQEPAPTPPASTSGANGAGATGTATTPASGTTAKPAATPTAGTMAKPASTPTPAPAKPAPATTPKPPRS